jgi:hypothetical protein
MEALQGLLPSAFHKPIPSMKITYILINGLCNPLKLAIFSLYVIYVLRLINILKYTTFFLNLQKYVGCISIGKQCFHHIHAPYALLRF